SEKLILVKTYLDMEEVEQARTILDGLLARAPDSVEVLSTKVNFDTNTGDFDSMRATVRKLVDQGTVIGSHLLTYARGGKIEKDDPIPAAMETAFSNQKEDDETRSSLGFALAKVYDDWGDYSRSFKYLKSANDEMRSKAGPTGDGGGEGPGLAQRVFERSVDLWGPAGEEPTTDAPKPRLIQITGMPRSGTTLVEQIVSSHSSVTAGGELGLLGNLVKADLDLLDLEDKPLSASGLKTFGADLTKAYAGMFPDADVVTDKGIMSNSHAGIYARALPQSRMVVLLRDPRDNCLSIYKNKFRLGTHAYSTDLEELARKYLNFLEIQKFWKEKAPGSFYEIRYEDLIENPEDESRRLIAYCGLDWEDACLEFYKNTRQVKTLSAFQVRQKIYSSSVGAWKHYEEELQPLIRILEDGGALEGY
ncbi:MAG TPA: sulfotransferase, partial [Aliiroseovarius sp.]|nr:sulfotransferase [Aliiroseovarius sp.]